MMQYLNWYSENPWLGTFILVAALCVVYGIVEAIARVLRTLFK